MTATQMANQKIVDKDFPSVTRMDFSGLHNDLLAITGPRALEIKELSVPVSKMDELKKFYRMIATDERNTAVLKPVGSGK
jgi:hypothetical protein